jgi:hypothetical protein
MDYRNIDYRQPPAEQSKRNPISLSKAIEIDPLIRKSRSPLTLHPIDDIDDDSIDTAVADDNLSLITYGFPPAKCNRRSTKLYSAFFSPILCQPNRPA